MKGEFRMYIGPLISSRICSIHCFAVICPPGRANGSFLPPYQYTRLFYATSWTPGVTAREPRGKRRRTSDGIARLLREDEILESRLRSLQTFSDSPDCRCVLSRCSTIAIQRYSKSTWYKFAKTRESLLSFTT